ncbi:hypothetical protein A2Y85_05260 [candidate division WOR-3 bacterium RBG_13_43_14]|uniref:T9SS type A sorting domain-containing protein n=1 Tax=candidate division WOR-3 bacterium RBG_13_43_14 TaxID=1802590 RepID=A0A1F4U9X8_UNCW3|nr:MAG: hypothetical protein A2Y85_05260 [candidate division WOR-3 bacterium RBG_13_43_14]
MKCFILLLAGMSFLTAGNIHPQLQAILDNAKTNHAIQVIVHMSNRSDLASMPKSATKAEKLIYLQTFAANDQKDILAFLSGYGDKVKNLKTYWIFNGFTFKATKEIIKAIAAREDVDYVIDDFIIKLDARKSSDPGSRTPEWNITMVSAPLCWNDGYDGAGIIVGNMDTGVEVTHAAFGNRWIPGGWFDGVNGNSTPYDDHGHGTHTMGTICGGDGNGSFVDDIGVAPGANFICAKAFDAGGSGQATWIHACFQWFATQTVHVVGNSWGSTATTSLEYWDDCINWRSLGIYPSFSIGNSGPNPGTGGTPGNFPIVTGVGATDNSDNMASFSSRGPAPNQTPWSDPSNWARPDWNLIKPDISAPGVNVRSAAPGGGYQSMQGTSMASPHVTGAVAICLQKNQTIDYGTLYNILLDNADQPAQGAPYPNNNYGWGRLNVYAALQAVPPPVPHHNIRAQRFDIPRAMEEEFTTLQPSVRFRNSGTFDETNVPVTCLIRIGMSTVYTSNRTISNLPQNTESLVVFDNFTIGQMGTHYIGYGISSLASDTFYNDDTTTMNFVAARKLEIISPGSLAWKYPNADSGSVPIPSHASWIPATVTELQQISTLDNNRWVTAGATDTAHQDLQLYGFMLNAPDTIIEQITVEWWGQHGTAPHNRVALYYWNDQTNTWSRRQNMTNVTADVLLTSTLRIDSTAMFVNPSTMFYAATGADVYVKSCCPLLFAYDGENHNFIGDLVSGGDLGTWMGQVLGQNLYLPPDFDEYVKIDGDKLASVDGVYRLTVNEMLQEVSYIDEVELYVIDHPAEYDVYPHEALRWPAYSGLSVHTAREKPLTAAYNDRNQDILYTLAHKDRIYVPFEKSSINGFAKPFSITIDIGELDDPGSTVLYLYGSTHFPDAAEISQVSDIYHASKQNMTLKNPTVEIRDRYKRWKKNASCGIPAGHQKVVTYPLYDEQGKSVFETDDHRIRLTFTHEVYIDKAWISSAAGTDYHIHELPLIEADLHYYGYAEYSSPDGKYPGDFNYANRVTRNYANVAGYYTRYGDVNPLLDNADDRFAIMNHGDEITLAFESTDIPELPDGWTRDYIFAAKGFYKMARPGRAYAYSVDPLPFRGMRDDLSADGIGYYPYDPSPGLIASLIGRLYAKICWDYPFTLRQAIEIVKRHLSNQIRKKYPDDLVEYCQQWNTRHVSAYYPLYYADAPPHLNLERVPLCEQDGEWTTHLASLGIPFGDHSLHSNYVRLWLVTTVPVGIAEDKTNIPASFAFAVGYPNPFRSSATVNFSIPISTDVNIAVYDASGRQIRTLVNGMQQAGSYAVTWNGTDDHNRKMAAGIYFVQFKADNYISNQKIVLLK